MSNDSNTDDYCTTVIPGKVAINKILETKNVLAFYARDPLWPVHFIVIPKTHITSLLDFTSLSEQLTAEIMKVVAEVAAKVTKEHGQCKVMTNVGDYQHTRHLHWHIYSEIKS